MDAPERAFRSAIRSHAFSEQKKILSTLELARRAHEEQKREDGTPSLWHLLETGTILCQWGADAETIMAGLLHDALEDTGLKRVEIEKTCGGRVASLVGGVTKFTQADFMGQEGMERKIETLRKLLEVMRSDMRVMIIKLADRLHNVRTMEAFPPNRRATFARETLDIYSIIARHLSMKDLYREFGELCVPVVYPEEASLFRRIRQEMLPVIRHEEGEVKKHLRAEDRKRDLRMVRFGGRSLQAMLRIQKRGDLTPEQAYYLVVIAKNQDSCYVLLKLLHTLYRPIGGKFRDYIAAPTEEGPPSLHTTVIGPSGRLLEVRIRTDGMDGQERKGVLLKLFQRGHGEYPAFSLLQRAEHLDLATRESSEAFWSALQSDLLQETISVTVNGTSLLLPVGTTALDAIYARYGDEGHRISSMEVNGAPRGLSEMLKDEDTIHVKLDATRTVSVEWLKASRTRFAKNLITAALKERDRGEKLRIGEQLTQKEMDLYRKGLLGELTRAQKHEIASSFRRESFEEVVAMVGEGVLQARDVIFHLFPEERKRSPLAWREVRPFSVWVHITGTHLRRQDILPKLSALAGIEGVEVLRTGLHYDVRTETFDLKIEITSPDRLHFADFLDALEAQEWTSTIQTLLSRVQKYLLLGSFALAFAVIVLDLLLLPYYTEWFGRLPILPSLLLQVFPLLPILGVNYYLLKLLRHYFVRLRQDRWFLGLASLLNVVGFLLVVLHGMYVGIPMSLLPLLGIFVLSLLYIWYRFFESERLFTPIEGPKVPYVSEREWTVRQRRKVVGYFIRLCGVAVWGVEPIYIRYTEVNTLSPFLRTFLLSMGVLLPFGLFVFLRNLLLRRGLLSVRLPYDRYFLLLIIGQVGLMYFKNASLIYTSGTNLLLFSNFSPVMGLLVASIFWRKQIPYLREPHHMFWIFLLAVAAGFGSSLLLFNSIRTAPATLLGDTLALVAMFFDLVLVIGQIQYIKKFGRTDGALLNLHIFFLLLLFTAPAVFALFLAGAPILRGLTTGTALLGMGIGLFVGVGQFLNYEAFKRIDGYLAFMMFNLSVLITFALETFAIGSLKPTPLLLLSGFLIISASIVAEYINSRCERRGE